MAELLVSLDDLVGMNSLGYGFDSRSGKTAGAALLNVPSFSDIDQDITGSGMSIKYELKLIEDTKSLAQSLGVSASATATVGAYGGNASASFASEHACDQNSTYMLASIVAHSPTYNLSANQLQALKLVPAAQQLLAKHPDEFYKAYGDYFISGWQNAAELHVLLVLKSSSQSDKQNIDAQAGASGGSWDAHGSFTSAFTQAASGKNLQVWITAQGGPDLQWSGIQAGGDAALTLVLQNMDKFATDVQNGLHTRRYRALLHPYADLTGLPISDFKDLNDIISQVDNLSSVTLTYLEKLNAIQYIQAYGTKQFALTDAKVLGTANDGLTDGITYLRSEIRRVQSLSEFQPSQLQDVSAIRKRPELKATEVALRNLPSRFSKVPTTAEDLRTIFGDASGKTPDGYYWIYVPSASGTLSPAKLYCRFPDGGLAIAYLDLPSESSDANISFWPVSDISKWAGNTGQFYRQGSSLRTKYSRIRIDTKTLFVDVRDAYFTNLTPATPNLIEVATTGHGDGKTEEKRRYNFAPFATASASNHAWTKDSQPRTPFGSANIDLRGTDFQIDTSATKWGASADSWDVKFSQDIKPDASNNFQLCHFQVGGAPATAGPINGLKLKFVGS